MLHQGGGRVLYAEGLTSRETLEDSRSIRTRQVNRHKLVTARNKRYHGRGNLGRRDGDVDVDVDVALTRWTPWAVEARSALASSIGGRCPWRWPRGDGIEGGHASCRLRRCCAVDGHVGGGGDAEAVCPRTGVALWWGSSSSRRREKKWLLWLWLWL